MSEQANERDHSLEEYDDDDDDCYDISLVDPKIIPILFCQMEEEMKFL